MEEYALVILFERIFTFPSPSSWALDLGQDHLKIVVLLVVHTELFFMDWII